ITGKRIKLEATRHQLPFELSFAITAHAAQGKTMSQVVADLNVKDAHGYVAASRAQTRNGLAIVKPVTLNSLNIPLKRELIVEAKRLKAIAHNTLIHYGFTQGLLMDVPDPEAETHVGPLENVKIVFEEEIKVSRKRKAQAKDPQDVPSGTSSRVQQKRRRT
ncbi:hypothetical protein DL93DRAFT_2208230, partial [Clavulina sp. PMI_390]